MNLALSGHHKEQAFRYYRVSIRHPNHLDMLARVMNRTTVQAFRGRGKVHAIDL